MNYDLSNLFKDAFGVDIPKEETQKTSYLGTPVLYPITFQNYEYLTANNNGGAEYREFSSFTLPTSCIADFRSSKNIITTRIAPNRVVKEIFSIDDYAITIRGFCIPDPMQKQGFKTVQQQLKRLEEWNAILDTICIEGDQFTGRNIECIAIENIDFQTLRGQPNVKPFTITAKSAPSKEETFLEITPRQSPN